MPESLSAVQKTKNFFIAIDSDGCVFDTMEVKHKECFCPVTIRHYGLQSISKFARESWEFVNLYSVHRGTNRFPALVKVMDQLRHRPEVLRRKYTIPTLDALQSWIQSNPKLSNPALADAVRTSPALEDTLQWSEKVNQAVASMVHGVPPFSYVHEALTEAAHHADMMVASATPVDTLIREWNEHGLADFVRVIAGQEVGPKSHQLSTAAASSYAPDHILMIGDSFSDHHAAKSIGACFYPILPGGEEDSWERLLREALHRFLNSEYSGEYEEELIYEMRTRLPEQPSWDL